MILKTAEEIYADIRRVMMNIIEGRRVYVAGFLLKGDGVLLVRKNRPKWQAGFLNGIGGELKPGESPIRAMEREYHEETGSLFTDWKLFATEDGPGYTVYFYRMRVPVDNAWVAPSANDVGEELCWQPIRTKEPVIGNLHWLLPLCLDPRDIVVEARTESNIREIRTW